MPRRELIWEKEYREEEYRIQNSEFRSSVNDENAEIAKTEVRSQE
jgi:hypothetical protein